MNAKLSKLRWQKQMTQTHLALLTGINVYRIHRLEKKANTQMTLNEAIAISAALKVNPRRLYDKEIDPLWKARQSLATQPMS